MKQQVAVLIGTLLVLPGCSQSGDHTADGGVETTATGAPASAEQNSSTNSLGASSTFDTSADSELNKANDAAAAGGSAVPPAAGVAGAQVESASTNLSERPNP